MRKVLAFVCAAVLCCMLAGVATAAEESAVPSSLEEIGNTALRDAVREHSPNYDDLGRGSQIFTYVHVYRWMNGGTPELTDEESAMLESMEKETAGAEQLDIPMTYTHEGETAALGEVITGTDWFDNPRLEEDLVAVEPIQYESVQYDW